MNAFLKICQQGSKIILLSVPVTLVLIHFSFKYITYTIYHHLNTLVRFLPTFSNCFLKQSYITRMIGAFCFLNVLFLSIYIFLWFCIFCVTEDETLLGVLGHEFLSHLNVFLQLGQSLLQELLLEGVQFS